MDIAPESIKILLPEKEKQASYDTPATSPQLPALHNGLFLLSRGRPSWRSLTVIYFCLVHTVLFCSVI